MRNFTLILLLHLGLLFTSKNTNAQVTCAPPLVGCSNNDFSNSFLNSTNPNTIEYDNIVSTFHSTIARQSDGKIIAWGERLGGDGSSDQPEVQEVNSANFPGLTGTVLKFTGGSSNIRNCQFIILTTDGLFATGMPSYVINTGLISSTSTAVTKILPINSNSYGLPSGVLPANVKMIFASTYKLAIVTCDGAAYTLVNDAGARVRYPGTYTLNTHYTYGDGDGVGNKTKWHRVSTAANTPLANVVAVRGCGFFNFMALTSNGNIYTWGGSVLLGNGTGFQEKQFATLMTKPAGVTPKMIGMSGFYFNNNETDDRYSYYLLGTNGLVYALGDNDDKQLGHRNTNVIEFSWVIARKPDGSNLDNVVWISPNEHDGNSQAGGPGINVLQSNGTLWAWGNDSYSMLGGGTNAFESTGINPTTNLGGLTVSDKLLAVETGGHTTITIKNCTRKFGYVGHKINGSMADGTLDDLAGDGMYDFNATAILALCSAPATAQIITPALDSADACNNTQVLQGNYGINATARFNLLAGNATLTGNTLNFTDLGPVKVEYVVESSSATSCTTKDTIIINRSDYGNLPTPKYKVAKATTAANNQTWLGSTTTNKPSTECITKLNDETDGLGITTLANTPVVGNGEQTTPFLLTGSAQYKFNVTINGSGTPKQVYWAVWYDVNGDGDFTDGTDIFQKGNTLHNGAIVTTFNITVPSGAGVVGATDGAIRVICSAEDPNYTKAMNGEVVVKNGEVEDYYVMYTSPLNVKLGDFTATKMAHHVLLKWNTVTETNNKGFYIERSANQMNWETLTFVPSAATNGQSASVLNYQFADEKLAGLTNQIYYRIKQVDFDSKFEYTPIKIVNLKGNAAISYYPNPVNDNLSVAGLDGNETILIINEQGQVLKSTKATTKNLTINIQDLSAGFYFMKVISPNQNSTNSYKIIKD
jgi:hypothetical protein